MTAAVPRAESSTSGRRHPGGRTALALTLVLAAGCGAPTPPKAPTPTSPPSALTPVPDVDGPLALRVSYPRDSLFIATRGSNFVFGSAGSGRARVWVNGREVEVQPNGGFLAFVPVPEDSVYRIRATLDGASQQVDVPVTLPPAPPRPGGRAVIAPGSVFPAGAWVTLPGERVEVGFLGTAGGQAWLELDASVRIPLVQQSRAGGGVTDFEVAPAAAEDATGEHLSLYRGFLDARPIAARDPAVAYPTLLTSVDGRGWRPGARGLEGADATVVLAFAGDTVRRSLPLNLAVMDPARPRVGVARDLDPSERNGDGRVVARVGPGGGPYHYFWANGVELELTGQRGGAYRVRLADGVHAWVPAGDVQLQVPGMPPPRSAVTTVRLDPQPRYVDAHIALDRRLPYRVEEGERSVAVVVYGATSRVNFLQHGRTDRYVDRAEWSQPADDVFRLQLRLTSMPWGYETFWGEGDDLVLRVRRPPALAADSPFAGLTVGVDPGHGGADSLTLGPTGLKEADANLGIALALRDELERRGARVVMSRTVDTTLSLVERTRLARAEDVDLWVSVHNNALPDGVEPWSNSGTSVYYNHPRAAGLAWSVQAALLEELGLRDLGVGRADLHQPRFTWAPSILTETMFMMIPRQEAFLKTEEGRRRVAVAHVRGIEAWLRERAGR